MINSYREGKPYKLIDEKTYAVMMVNGSVEVLQWLQGLGWRRLNGEYISGEEVSCVVRSVKI